jgi:hypothetical protein
MQYLDSHPEVGPSVMKNMAFIAGGPFEGHRQLVETDTLE